MAGIERAVRELPGGVVTFAFTDTEASTGLVRALGDAADLGATDRDQAVTAAT